MMLNKGEGGVYDLLGGADTRLWIENDLVEFKGEEFAIPEFIERMNSESRAFKAEQRKILWKKIEAPLFIVSSIILLGILIMIQESGSKKHKRLKKKR